jgi:hypothetical protein
MKIDQHDFELLERIAAERVTINADNKKVLTRVAKILLGRKVDITSVQAATQLRNLLRELNAFTGDVVLQIEDASSEEEVTSILMEVLAECGSPLHRGTIIAAAKNRIRALGRQK